MPAQTAAAARLRSAARDRTPCAPVRDLIGSSDVSAAYAVQRLVTDARIAAGARLVGWKIGLTSAAVQRQLAVDRPDFGVLFNDMDASGPGLVPFDRLLQPRIEAEIAFVLGADLADGPLHAAQIRAAVDHARPALEIVDSRIDGWDITFADTVADNASGGLFVLGESPVALTHFEPVAAEMQMYLGDAVVSTGNGAACLGDPLLALAWLAQTTRELGDPLRAGHVILSGALGPMVTVAPGATVRAEITGLGAVHANFSADGQR